MENNLHDWIAHALKIASDFVWGPVTLALLLGTGLFLTIRLGGVQFRGLFHSLYLAFVKRKESSAQPGDITHFQALMTALAATVGTGNIAGVATAIASGGPGAPFWMWMTALVGMATKYAEAVLAVRYRVANARGEMSGGPMYYIARGLNLPWLGMVFAFFAAIAAFGIGDMVQSNSVADAVHHTFHIPTWVTGALLTFFTGIVLLGGIKSIARVAEVLVPVMVVFYILASLTVICLYFGSIPEIFMLVLTKAFTPQAAVGGFLGATVKEAMRFGIARGVFSNESGLGSSPIAAAAAKTSNPATQALVSMTQTFIDTIIVCSMTTFVILVSEQWQAEPRLTGAKLSMAAFGATLPGNAGAVVVTVGLITFAYSTLLGWSYYGEKSVEYLLGERAVIPYRVLYTSLVFVGAVVKLDLVWSFADLLNGLMAWPNLIGLIGLSGVAAEETRRYFSARRAGESNGRGSR